MSSKYDKTTVFAIRSVDRSVFVLLLPIVLFFTIFLIYPLLYIFKESFWIDGRFGLSYFKLIVTDGNARELVTNSFKIGIAVTIATTFVSLTLAYFLTRYRFPGRSTLQGIILIPIIMPPFVGAIGMQKLFGLYGSVNMFLTKIGLIEFADTD